MRAATAPGAHRHEESPPVWQSSRPHGHCFPGARALPAARPAPLWARPRGPRLAALGHLASPACIPVNCAAPIVSLHTGHGQLLRQQCF